MKTSFYFVLWTIIIVLVRITLPYEYLPSVEVTFNMTCIFVICLYWVINHMLSIQMCNLYETKLQRVKSFKTGSNIPESRLKQLTFSALSYFTVAYFIISVMAITWTIYRINVKDWWIRLDWLGLIIFIAFSVIIINRTIRMENSRKSPNQPELPDSKHQIEYTNHVKSSEPEIFRSYNLLSIISAIFSISFGLFTLCSSVYLFFTHIQKNAIGLACIFYLYGSLAAYYGIKDLISSLQNNRNLHRNSNL